MKPITAPLAALAVLLLAPCACTRRDAAPQGSTLVTASATGAILPAPLPADLPPPVPAAEPESPPSPEELAAFHAPVPK